MTWAQSVVGSNGGKVFGLLGALVFLASFGGVAAKVAVTLLGLLLVDVLYDFLKASGKVS